MTVEQFTNATLPEAYGHQIRDFIRIHWFDAFTIDPMAPVTPDEWNPQHFVLAQHPALYAHAATVSQPALWNGQPIASGGLSGVFTYPAFRRRGWGLEVVAAATTWLKSSDLDIALLWTDAQGGALYRKAGWGHLPEIRCFSESHGQKTTIEGECYALAISSKGTRLLGIGTAEVLLLEGAW